jgi:tetratricopeptide (TPR) repeat protein
MLAHARLLAAERRWDEARGVLERLLRSAEGANAAETALALGETWDAQGDHLSAAEYFMTAAYLAPESPAGRRALLAAGRSFAAAKDSEAAAIVYRKLLAQSDVPGEVADAARRGLAELRR